VDFVESTETGIVGCVWVIHGILPLVLYGCETRSLTLKGYHIMRMLKGALLVPNVLYDYICSYGTG
jgi:hypothetical protein